MTSWFIAMGSAFVAIISIVAFIMASVRLIRFDELFGLLVEEIDTNVNYLNKLLLTPVFSNSPEIIGANRNMGLMRARLDEYVRQMEYLTGRELRKRKEVPRPPVVA